MFPLPDCEEPEYFLGNGMCDSLVCGWDGGDCCRCTCVDRDDQRCQEFDYLDPDATADCETEDSSESVATPGVRTPSQTCRTANATQRLILPCVAGTGETAVSALAPTIVFPAERPVTIAWTPLKIALLQRKLQPPPTDPVRDGTLRV